MIGRLQRIKLLNQIVGEQMQGGRFPSLGDSLSQVTGYLKGRRFGAPLAQFRPAIMGHPIGGTKGNDIQLTFEELLDDLKLLFAAQVELAARSVDLYDIFGTRRDRLALKMAQLRLSAQTALAQQAAASRTSVVDSFQTLDFVNLDTTTAQVDLSEGICCLPPDQSSSVRYDGSRVKVVKTILPTGGRERGHTFETVFSPYRLDAWYATIPVGSTYEVHVNATGADYSQGETDEVTLNAVTIEPTGPIHVAVDWSPDGFNWHNLSPAPSQTIRDRTTFHFNPVRVGFLRFRLTHSEEVATSNAGRQKPIGIKRIELLAKGFSSSASLYSNEYRFTEAVHTVVAQSDQETPVGTRIVSYVSQSAAGPWTQLVGGPVTFDTIQWQEVLINTLAEEQSGVPATMWQAAIPEAAQPLPNSGELIAGRGQVQLSAFPFDWRQLGDHDHILEQEDWDRKLGMIRSGVLIPAGALGDLNSDGFTSAKNPLGTDDRQDNESFMVLTLVQTSGQFVLQPGYNYRLRAYLWCSTPVTLENQRIGVVNPSAHGGLGNTKVAPVSVFVNNTKIYQNQTATTHVNLLSGSQYLATIPLVQGWNALEILMQVPADLALGQNGLATQDVYLYFQPNLFSQNLSQDLKIDYIQAWQEPWKRVTEFDLRYNTALGNREVWAFKFDNALNLTSAFLLNHDPMNSANQAVLHPSYTTLDGTSAGYPVNLILRYPVEIPMATDQRALFYRADFLMDPGAVAPPILKSYKLIVN
jgi:hypothetical protein